MHTADLRVYTYLVTLKYFLARTHANIWLYDIVYLRRALGFQGNTEQT